MESLHLQIWTHIGAMNRAIGAPVSDPARFKTAVINAPDRRSAFRFMESPQFILKRIATMNRSLRKSLIFKGGILRFMESLDLQQSDAHWDHEPSEKPQRNGGTQSWLLCAPSFLCGSIGRFMESLDLQFWTRIGAMNQAIGAPVSDTARFKAGVTNAPDRRSALRFMESGAATDGNFSP